MEVLLSIPTGGILAVTGSSGSGKTTLLRQIAGLISPQMGYIQYNKKIWLDTDSKINILTQKRNIGFVFQDYALFPHLTVRENLTFGLEKGIETTIVDELLHSVDLFQLADRRPYQL